MANFEKYVSDAEFKNDENPRNYYRDEDGIYYRWFVPKTFTGFDKDLTPSNMSTFTSQQLSTAIKKLSYYISEEMARGRGICNRTNVLIGELLNLRMDKMNE